MADGGENPSCAPPHVSSNTPSPKGQSEGTGGGKKQKKNVIFCFAIAAAILAAVKVFEITVLEEVAGRV